MHKHARVEAAALAQCCLRVPVGSSLKDSRMASQSERVESFRREVEGARREVEACAGGNLT